MGKEIEELENKLKELKESFVVDEITVEEYREKEKEILAEIKELGEREEYEKEDVDDKVAAKESVSSSKINLWPIISIVLLVVLIGSVFTGGFGLTGKSTGAQGNVISAQAASVKAVNYINNLLQGQGTAKVLSIQDTGSLYSLKLDVGGQTFYSYVTKDGELLFPTSIDLTQPLPKPTDNQPSAPADTTKTDVSVDDDASIGPINAKVTIIEFSDYQCPFCERVEPTVKQILQTYGDKVRFVYRDFPLSFHQYAQKAAEASECAHEQNKFWEYHDKLFENQGALDSTSLKQYAKDLGLDTTKFNECLDSGKYQSEVKKDFNDGQKAGVSGTPAFFINGQLISGAQPFSAFKEVIDAELAK